MLERRFLTENRAKAGVNVRMADNAAWWPDPTGRHEFRYWDGSQWTEHVADSGVTTTDPLVATASEAASRAADEVDASVPPYVHVHSIHADFPESPDAFPMAQRAAQWMWRDGHTFHGVLLDSQGNRLTPEWIDVSSGWIDEATGRSVVTGTITHAALGLDEAYDLGTRDGRNLPFGGAGVWGPTPDEALAMPYRQVFLGNVRTGAFWMTEVGGDVYEVAVSPDGNDFATLERFGLGPFRLTIGRTDADSRRRELGAFEYADMLRFSPDGRWIAFTSGGLRLVDRETGQHWTMPMDGWSSGWDWWPGRTPSVLHVTYDHETRVNRLTKTDLPTGAAETIGEVVITLPDGTPPDSCEPKLLRPEISPDGRSMLAMSKAFMWPGRDSDYSPRFGPVLVDLHSLDAQPLGPTFIDGPDGPFPPNSLTVEHHDHRWTQRAVTWNTGIPTPPEMEPARSHQVDQEQLERIGDESLQIASLALEYAIGMPRFSGPGPGALLPEIIRYCVAAREHATGWARLDEWLMAGASVWPQVRGSLRPEVQHTWDELFQALDLVRLGRHDQIDYARLAKVGREDRGM